jgi:hypothetical protein
VRAEEKVMAGFAEAVLIVTLNIFPVRRGAENRFRAIQTIDFEETMEISPANRLASGPLSRRTLAL